MANESGFKFKINAVVFVPQASILGADIVSAFNEADELRTRIQAELLDLPADFTITQPIRATRRVIDPDFVEVEDGEGKASKA